MAGVLYKGDPTGVEATGVYRGVLTEDMIDTVKKVKKPFIDVYIESLFFKDSDYPLTYVPMFNMVLPLKKDQEVFVYFSQDNHRYPVLWKLADEVSKEYTDKSQLPANGSLVSFPPVEDTTEVVKFSDSYWFIGTKSYGVFRWGDQCVLLNDDSVITNAKSNILFKSGGDFKAEVKQDTVVDAGGDISLKSTTGVTLESSAGKVVLKAATFDLGSILSDLFTNLSSGLQSGTSITGGAVSFPGLIPSLTEAVTKISAGFKE